MKVPLIKGHPIHALLSDLPIGTTVATVVCDLLGTMTHHAGWRFAARAVLAHDSRVVRLRPWWAGGIIKPCPGSILLGGSGPGMAG